MRRSLFPFAILTSCSLLAPGALAADLERLTLTPPALIQDLVDETKVAQGYDDAYDDEEEADTTKPAGETPRRRRRRDNSSGSQTAQSSSSSGSSSSNSSGSSDYVFGASPGGEIAPMGKQIGVGIQIGAPTALTVKLMLTGDQALVAGLGAGYGFFFSPALSVHVDYLWHPALLTGGDAFALSWYIGVGGWLGLWDGNRRSFVVAPYTPYYVYAVPVALAVRVPIGLSFALKSVPLEFYGEAAPALSVFPGIGFGLGFTIGVRFYF